MSYEHYLLIANIVMAVAMVISARIMYVAECRRNKQEKLEPKRDVLRRLVAHTYRLTKSLKGQDGEPFIALNEANVVFSDSGDVMKALTKMHDELSKKDRMIDNIKKLVEEMAKASEVPADNISKKILERPFTPPTS